MKTQNKRNKFVFRALGIASASLLAFACSSDDDDSAPADTVTDPLPPPADVVPPAGETTTTVDPPAEEMGAGEAAPPAQPPATDNGPDDTGDNGDNGDNAVPPPGNPEADCTDTNGTITFDTLWEQIQSDFLQQDVDDQAFTRYITLQNRFNAGVCGNSAEMDMYRNGLQKSLNSLSVESRIERAVPIDARNLTFRIDIRDYGWDEAVIVDDGVVAGGAFNDKWEAIVGLSPFAVEFQGDQADQVKLQGLTDFPMINADALVDAAQIGNLYYALVEIPDTLEQLLLDLQVNRAQDQDQEREFRAGTTQSTVSRQDTTVVRNVINAGGNRGLWQRFDFEAANDSDSIFIDAVDFVADESSAIFTLNNGLLAYAVFDELGNRLEESEVMIDVTQDDNKTRSAVSCSGCHGQGLLAVTDEVNQFARDNVFQFDNDDFEFITDLYVQDSVDSSLANDNGVYENALRQTGTPLNDEDPVRGVFVRFDDDLDLNAVAGDVGISPRLLLSELSNLDPALQVVRSATIDRDDFTELFQATICQLQTFSTNRPDDILCQGFIDALELGI